MCASNDESSKSGHFQSRAHDAFYSPTAAVSSRQLSAKRPFRRADPHSRCRLRKLATPALSAAINRDHGALHHPSVRGQDHFEDRCSSFAGQPRGRGFNAEVSFTAHLEHTIYVAESCGRAIACVSNRFRIHVLVKGLSPERRVAVDRRPRNNLSNLVWEIPETRIGIADNRPRRRQVQARQPTCSNCVVCWPVLLTLKSEQTLPVCEYITQTRSSPFAR